MSDTPQTDLAPEEADGVTLPSELDFPCFLMNFPFSVDNRESNNALMDDGAEPYDMKKAFNQFMAFYGTVAKEALVYILPSGGDYQDLPYVANLGAGLPHMPNVMLLSNFTSPPRQGEDDVGHVFFTQMGYDVHQSPFKWEGEADLKFIRENIYIGGFGQRTELAALRWMANTFDMEVAELAMTDPKLYHLDCTLFPLSDEKIMVATSCYLPEEIANLEAIAEIIDVPKQFAYDGWTNSLRLNDRVLNNTHGDDSAAALEKLLGKHGFELEMVDLEQFSKSGADLSCMVCHLNAHNRGQDEENPSTSPAQKRTMAALAHGWVPPKGSKVARIPLSVAQDFFKADAAIAHKRKRSLAQS